MPEITAIKQFGGVISGEQIFIYLYPEVDLFKVRAFHFRYPLIEIEASTGSEQGLRQAIGGERKRERERGTT